MKFSLSLCRPGSWAVLVGLAVALSPARAEDTPDTMQALKTAMRAEITEQQPKPAAEEDERASFRGRAGSGEMFLAQLQSVIDSDEPQGIDRVLNEIPEYFKSDAVRTASTKLRDELRRQREAKDEALVKSCRDAIGEAGQAVRSANTPADLDATLRALGEPGQRPDYRAPAAVSAVFERVRGARRFVIGWQDYLSARGHGDSEAARQSLQNISSSDEPDLMPRSEILARVEDLKAAKEHSLDDGANGIVERTKTLDDIAGSLFALEALQQKTGNDYAARTKANALVTELQLLGGIYNDYRAGLPTTVERLLTRISGADSPAPQMLGLREQLLRLVCARQLNVENRFKPGAQEPFQDYLKRVMADAQERCDVRLIVHVKELQTRADAWSSHVSNQSYSPSQVNLQSLLAAQNQEEAGQYVPAVISYQAALKTGGDLVPAKAIGTRLDAIKAAHPTEFEKGMELSLREPAADRR